VIQAYIIIDTLILISIIGSLIVGRATAPKKQVTVTETIEVPSYEANSLPVAEEVTYFDVPLSHSLQRYIYEVCADEEVPVSLVIAMIDKESRFNPETVSDTGDYGLMQINKINHETLEEQYRATDMLDPYQNVFCGVKMIGSYIKAYDSDYNKALMAYNMGDYGAKKAWENGITSTSYSESVLALMQKYEQEITS
jgi:soluble lytic murein transglycosylase-like protein